MKRARSFGFNNEDGDEVAIVDIYIRGGFFDPEYVSKVTFHSGGRTTTAGYGMSEATASAQAMVHLFRKLGEEEFDRGDVYDYEG